METPNNDKKPKELSKQEKREQWLDELFGKNRKEYIGNMWGWRFSLLSLVLFLGMGFFAIYGTQQGWIRWDTAEEDKKPLKHPLMDKDTTKNGVK